MDDITKSIYAVQLSENPLLTDALDYFEQEITAQWKQEKNAEEREKLWRMLYSHRAFKQYITMTISGGKIAAQQIAHKTFLQKVRSFR